MSVELHLEQKNTFPQPPTLSDGRFTVGDAYSAKILSVFPHEILAKIFIDSKSTHRRVNHQFNLASQTAMHHFWIEKLSKNPIFARHIQQLRNLKGSETWNRLSYDQKLKELLAAMLKKIKDKDPKALEHLNVSGRNLDFLLYQELADLLALLSLQSRIAMFMSHLNPYLGVISLTNFREFLNHPDNQTMVQEVRHLDLSQLFLGYLPQEIYLFTNLECLCLNHNNLTSVPPLAGFARLSSLSLANNKINTLQGAAFPSGLNLLNLNCNELSKLQDIASALPAGIRSLYLKYNAIAAFEGAALPDGLEALDLDLNEIDTLKGVILPNRIKYLSLSYNRISSLQGALLPDRVEFLDLSHNRIFDLQGAVLPTRLVYLNLSCNGIFSLQDVTFPDSLANLDLSDNRISSLQGVAFPNGLRFLQLNDNLIATLQGAAWPENLERLNLSNNYQI